LNNEKFDAKCSLTLRAETPMRRKQYKNDTAARGIDSFGEKKLACQLYNNNIVTAIELRIHVSDRRTRVISVYISINADGRISMII
jgi:hypothetical protein